MAQPEDGTAPHLIFDDAATHLELNELKGLVHAHTEELKTGPDTCRSPFQLNFRGYTVPAEAVRGPGRKSGASLYTRKRLSLSV
jgi:hypothetical protein